MYNHHHHQNHHQTTIPPPLILMSCVLMGHQHATQWPKYANYVTAKLCVRLRLYFKWTMIIIRNLFDSMHYTFIFSLCIFFFPITGGKHLFSTNNPLMYNKFDRTPSSPTTTVEKSEVIFHSPNLQQVWERKM